MIRFELNCEVIGDMIIATLVGPDGQEVFRCPFAKQDIPIIEGVVTGLSSYFQPDKEIN